MGRRGNRPGTFIISAPAKINLFLHVTGKRPDGYHDIISWFQALDLADRLEIELLPDNNTVEIHCRHTQVPTDQNNLIYMAAKLLQEKCQLSSGFRVTLEKNIPVAAGLGGGSSDAVAFFKAANQLMGLGLHRHELEQMALEIGSDLPFFFSCGQAEVTGRGEGVRDIALPIDYQVALVTPPFGISAREAYERLNLDLTDSVQDISLRRCRQVDGLFDAISMMANDLERGLLESYPVLDRIKDVLAKTGAGVVRVSGSGPTVFALYRNRCQMMEKLAQICEGGKWGLAWANPVVLPA